MKTLFLLGILVFLAIIAVKKPNQTAWDAARDLQDHAKNVIASADPAMVSNLPPLSDSATWKDVQKTIFQAANTIKTTERPSQTNKNKSKGTVVPKSDWALDPGAPAVKIAPKPAAFPLPDIPAVPVQPVQMVEKLEEPKISPLPKVLSRPSSNYVDVKVFYEKANRFLDQIK